LAEFLFFSRFPEKARSGPPNSLKTVLTIAGFDPSSGAGVTADLMVFAAHGLFGVSCITALTVQSTPEVRSVSAVSAEMVRETLACLQEDITLDGIKIGMLATSDNVQAVCECLESLRRTAAGGSVPVVLDPVIASSSGTRLLDESGLEMLRERLLDLVDWVTPNVPELVVLTGREVHGPQGVPEACAILQQRSGRSLGVFAKGGHFEKPDDYLVEADGEGLWIPGERVDTRSTHGTGCALSSAFLSRLVLGNQDASAAKLAKEYVAGALRSAEPVGRGSGPMNHLWPILKVTDSK
jgi:hydroxymethylpyrimidine/phosphomethylpyrimidine kinase